MNDAHSGRHYAEGGPEHGQDPYQQQYYDPYATQRPQQQTDQGYAYDPYTQQYYDPYAEQPQQGYSYPYVEPQGMPQQSAQQVDEQQWIPQQQPYDAYGRPQPPPPRQAPAPPTPRAPEPPHTGQQPRVRAQARPGERGPGGRGPGDPGGYRTEQFSFIEENDEDSEDVIDWLKFAETRSERRDERKRRGRNRIVALVVVTLIALAGGVGYLWYAGKLPALPGSDPGARAASGPQKRDVIVVHLRTTRGGGSSTALLVDNETTKKGTTVLLPNSMALATDDGGSTTLGKSVVDEGTTPTRDALDSLLGSDIKGSWRLDTPYLEILVESIGGIEVDTDVTVPAAKKGEAPLVRRGEGQTLSGQAAVAYATHRGRGEQQTQQLKRFGQVMQAVLRKFPSSEDAATSTVQSLNQIPDPSLTESQLGASLAQLAEQAKGGSYATELLPVQADGTLSEKVSQGVVKDVLGGTVKNTDPGAAPRVSVRNASGDAQAASSAQVALVNGGYTFVDGGRAGAAQVASQVTYADAAQAEKAKEVAKTLGLPGSAVKKGKGAPNADVTVVLGRDYDAG
ncbi:LytR C-terminal domain-containing protein [Streptomyces sp. NPDC051776]|uniref:LCP family protein n=1 Tax=Streptomyces sp. NPDC051776 TaxID=3155414 RepID=UPI0034351407